MDGHSTMGCYPNAKWMAACRFTNLRAWPENQTRNQPPGRYAILHSSFILLHLPAPASHYVKVMPDQIFGENNLTN
jgi:hypothetical protein